MRRLRSRRPFFAFSSCKPPLPIRTTLGPRLMRFKTCSQLWLRNRRKTPFQRLYGCSHTSLVMLSELRCSVGSYESDVVQVRRGFASRRRATASIADRASGARRNRFTRTPSVRQSWRSSEGRVAFQIDSDRPRPVTGAVLDHTSRTSFRCAAASPAAAELLHPSSGRWGALARLVSKHDVLEARLQATVMPSVCIGISDPCWREARNSGCAPLRRSCKLRRLLKPWRRTAGKLTARAAVSPPDLPPPMISLRAAASAGPKPHRPTRTRW